MWDDYIEAQRARVWAAYDEALQDYLDWIRFGADFACDVPFDPPQRPCCPRPKLTSELAGCSMLKRVASPDS
jgi:hypothetical protein